MSIIYKKLKEVACKRCKGTGESNTSSKYCSLCNGTGIYKEHYATFIDDKKGIAISGEPGQ